MSIGGSGTIGSVPRGLPQSGAEPDGDVLVKDRTKPGGFDWKSQSALSVDASGLTGQLPASAYNPLNVVLAEYNGPASVVYVDRNHGSDSNVYGNSPGNAFATVAKAARRLIENGVGGKIVILGFAVGALNIDAPLAFPRAIVIESAHPAGVSLTRNFGTSSSRTVLDPIVTAAGTQVSSASASFTNSDANRILVIAGAGAGGGTFYDFVSGNPPDGTHANFTAPTTVARNPTNDPVLSKMQIVGDWNRVVTDAAMTTGTAVVTSASGAFVSADVGTELVIAGAGQGGQALRGAVLTRTSATQVTITATASNTVSGARCAIGVNFGDMLTFHASQSGLKNLVLTDTSGDTTRIGSAVKLVAADLGAGAASNPTVDDFFMEDVTITGSAAAGPWEHAVDVDGAWNQRSGGPGSRRCSVRNIKCFGSRIPGQTLRLSSAVHWAFTGGGLVGQAPTSLAQGIVILDPSGTSGGQGSSADVHMSAFEGIGARYYCEGQDCTFLGKLGLLNTLAGRSTVELAATSARCNIMGINTSSLGTPYRDELNLGAASNRILMAGGNRITAVKTAAYTIVDGDELVRGDATAGTFDVTLPSAVGRSSKAFTVKHVRPGGNTFRLLPNGSEKIENLASKTLQPGDALTVVGDGTNWVIA